MRWYGTHVPAPFGLERFRRRSFGSQRIDNCQPIFRVLLQAIFSDEIAGKTDASYHHPCVTFKSRTIPAKSKVTAFAAMIGPAPSRIP